MNIYDSIQFCIEYIKTLNELINKIDMTTGNSVEILQDLKYMRSQFEKQLTNLNLTLIKTDKDEKLNLKLNNAITDMGKELGFTKYKLVTEENTDPDLKFPKRIRKNKK